MTTVNSHNNTVNSYMNYAFCALAVISLVGITVAILVSM
jgi:hypothetical protein